VAITEDLLDQLIKDYKKPEDLIGSNGLLNQLTKRLLERAMQAEMTDHLGYPKNAPTGNNTGNSRNGSYKKKVKGDFGELDLSVPRDRNATFDPAIIPKGESRFKGFDDKIISMYARGMTTRDIQSHLEEMYGVDVSPTLISQVTEAVTEEVRLWQNRPLDDIYPIVYLDAVRIKVKHNGQIITKAVYLAIAVTMEGVKDVLGMWAAENEGAKFWLAILTELKNRGVKDILIACVDGLKGFPEAIAAIYPQTEIQLCIVHQIRNSLRYVASKDQKAFMADLKPIYRADTKGAAEVALDELEEKWGEKYGVVIQSWRTKWHLLSAYFKYPKAIRKPIYTTNAVEAVHRQFRKLTKTKGAFPNEDSLMKLLYIGIQQASEKWTMPIQEWGQTITQLSIYFEGRLDDIIKI